MGFSLTSPAPEKCDPTAKNRVWGFFGEAPETSRPDRPQSLQPRREKHPTTTKVASGRTYWPSRDPIGERGGINLYGMVGNDAVSRWDYLGLLSDQQSSPPGITFTCECTTVGDCGCIEENFVPWIRIIFVPCFEISATGSSRIETGPSGKIENPHKDAPPMVPPIIGGIGGVLEIPKFIDAFPEVLAQAKENAQNIAVSECKDYGRDLERCKDYLEKRVSCVCHKVINDGWTKRALKAEEKNGVLGEWEMVPMPIGL